METPHTRQFDLHEIKRILVKLTPSARSLIAASGREGNKFPVALSEVFGNADQDVTIVLDGVKRSDHHVAEHDKQRLLHIQIFQNDICRYETFIADHALWHEPMQRRGFDANDSAQQILRLYLHVTGGQ
jgi:hypothetical protein